MTTILRRGRQRAGPDGRRKQRAQLRRAGLQARARVELPPGEAGAWILVLAPVEGVGSKESPWSYTGHITRFMILSDRDEGGSRGDQPPPAEPA
jgi:hypothetical protein